MTQSSTDTAAWKLERKLSPMTLRHNAAAAVSVTPHSGHKTLLLLITTPEAHGSEPFAQSTPSAESADCQV